MTAADGDSVNVLKDCLGRHALPEPPGFKIFRLGLSSDCSASTLKPDWGGSDHPSLADLGSIADLSAKFQSLTARKLMAGLSISSIDTLLEVNSDERNNGKLSILNESTETIDFGVI